MTTCPSPPILTETRRTHPVRWVLARLRRRPRTTAAVVLALLLGVTGWCRSSYRDPTYTFRLEGVKDPQQVVDLVRLAAELREVREWNPSSASDAAAEGVADWIREKNSEARTRTDLLRASSQPEFAACNGLVQLLPDLTPKDLSRWREAKRDNVVAEIRTLFRERAAADREVAYAEILGREMARTLLRVVPIPSYPETPTWSRRTACRLGGKRLPDRELWVGAFIDAVESQLRDRGRKYLSISQSLPHVVGTGEVIFLLKPLTPSEGGPRQRCGGRSILARVDVLHNVRASSSSIADPQLVALGGR